MLNETLVGELFKKLLSLLLPNTDVKNSQYKQQLGRYLLKTISIVDSYSFECDRIKDLIKNNLIDSKIKLFDRKMSVSVARLSRLTTEFAEVLREIEYLKVFDLELIRSFHSSMELELGNPLLGYVGLLDEADCLDVSYNPQSKALTLTFAEAYYGTPASGPEQVKRKYSLRNLEDRKALKVKLQQIQKTIEKSHCQAAKFLRKHFTPAEIFPMREEL
jgi:hypothetical protein